MDEGKNEANVAGPDTEGEQEGYHQKLSTTEVERKAVNSERDGLGEVS